MTKSFITSLFALLATTFTFAQATKVTVKIVAPAAYNGYVAITDPFEKYNPTPGVNGMVLNDQQTATRILTVDKPHDVLLSFRFSSPNSTYPDRFLHYALFVSPGDEINFTVDFDKKDNGIVVTGKGSKNNQPQIAPVTDIFATMGTRDTSAWHAIGVINTQQKLNEKILDNYIRKYQPSAEFVKNSRINLAYYPAVCFYTLKTNTLNYSRNFGPWQHIQDSLFATIKINNDDALTSFSYRTFLDYLLMRTKEKAWAESSKTPAAFYKEWYGTDATEGKKLFAAERKNLFVEKVLNKNFTGKTAEYLYAEMFAQSLTQSNIENIGLIFEHFKQRYPSSKYIDWFSGPIAVVAKTQANALNDKMVFVGDNGTKINSLNDVLALTKGKTVLLDMWGTWCAPCREEIEQNSAPLRDHFKDKDVTFLYIANFDMENQEQWKKLIAYFKLEGTHILASDKLTKDIMAKVKSNGYPAYILIKKDGTYALTKSQHPVDRQAMIQELDEALAMKE